MIFALGGSRQRYADLRVARSELTTAAIDVATAIRLVIVIVGLCMMVLSGSYLCRGARDRRFRAVRADFAKIAGRATQAPLSIRVAPPLQSGSWRDFPALSRVVESTQLPAHNSDRIAVNAVLVLSNWRRRGALNTGANRA